MVDIGTLVDGVEVLNWKLDVCAMCNWDSLILNNPTSPLSMLLLTNPLLLEMVQKTVKDSQKTR